jgi:hypothetical protein
MPHIVRPAGMTRYLNKAIGVSLSNFIDRHHAFDGTALAF